MTRIAEDLQTGLNFWRTRLRQLLLDAKELELQIDKANNSIIAIRRVAYTEGIELK